MAISTNGTVLARVAGALYNTQLSYATYQEVTAIVTTSASLNALVNDLYARDFASTKDLTVAQTLVSNLGLSTVAGLDSWVAAQITAAGAANKGAKIVELLNSFSQMASDVTYGSAATLFNTKTDAALGLAQTVGNTGGTFSDISTAIAGKVFTLTVNADSFTGTAGDDTFNAMTASASPTLTSSDSLVGGAGADTLYIALGQAFTVPAGRVSGIENIVLQSPVTGDFDMTGITGATSISTQTPASAANLTNVSGATTAISVSNTSSGATNTVTFKAAGLTGSSDALNLTLSGVNGSLIVNTDTSAVNAFESATIKSTGASSTLGGSTDISASTVTSLTVNGDAALTFGTSNAGLTVVDGSAMTAGLSLSSANVTAGAKVTGGSGNDTFTGGAGNDTISGGAGNDSITAGSGNDNVDAGSGNDTVTLTASVITSADTIVGGDGTDTLKIGAALTYSTSTNDAANISGFETLSSSSATAVTQNMTGLNVGNTISAFTAGGAGTATLQNIGAGFATLSTGSQTTAGAVLGLATNGTADALTVNIGSASNAGTASVTLGLSATQFETVTVNSAGASTASNTVNLGLTNSGDGLTDAVASTATSLASLTVTGNRNVSIAGSGNDALKTVTASAFTGDTLSVTTASKVATTVTAGGNYAATITTGTGADTITTGSGSDVITASSGNNTISAGDGNNNVSATTGDDSITTGAGDDTIAGGDGTNTITAGDGANSITGGTGVDKVTTGSGNDIISVGAGNNVISAGDGTNTITTTTGADSVTSGTGADTIDVGAGNDTVSSGSGADSISAGAGDDSITAGDGNDTIDASTGNDYVDGGAGDDSITAGTGSDTLVGGTGNDIFVMGANLTSADSIVGGDGTDRMDATISASVTPVGISTVETLNLSGGFGTGSTAITVDLKNVTGVTTMVTNVVSTGASVINTAPSTLTKLYLADGTTNTGNFTLDYDSSPTSLTVYADSLDLGVFTTTDVDKLSISQLLTSDYTLAAGVAATSATTRVYTSSMASVIDSITTSARDLTLSVDAQTAGTAVSGYELSVYTGSGGAITAASLENFTVSAGNYAGVQVESATTTSATSMTGVTLTAGTNSSILLGGVTASSTTTVSGVTITGGDGGYVNTGALQFGSAAVIDSVSITGGAGGDIRTGTLTAGTITSLSLSLGASSATATDIGTIASSVTGGSITLNTGTDENIAMSQTSGVFGTSTTPIYIYGNSAGTPVLTLTGASAVINASSFGVGLEVAGTLSGAITFTGSANSDTVLGGGSNDTFTIGEGADSIDGGDGTADHVSFAGRGLAISFTNNSTANTNARFTAGGVTLGYIQDVERITGTSFHDTITGGTGAETLVGGSGNDALDGGAGIDSVDGGLGNDTINGGSGNTRDSLTGSGGDDVFVFNADSATAISVASGTITAGTAISSVTFTLTNADVITDFNAGDVLRFETVHAMAVAAANTPTDNKVTYITGAYDVLATGTFTPATYTASTAPTSLAGTLVIYDSDPSTSVQAWKAIVLVGYYDITTPADAFSTSGVTGLVGTGGATG